MMYMALFLSALFVVSIGYSFIGLATAQQTRKIWLAASLATLSVSAFAGLVAYLVFVWLGGEFKPSDLARF